MDIELLLLIVSDKDNSLNEATKSFTELYEKHRKFLYNVILNNIYNERYKDYAQNILDDVFLYIWENPLKWEFNNKKHKTQESGFKAYLSTIAYYKIKEFIKDRVDLTTSEIYIIDNDSGNDWLFILSDEELDQLSDNQKLIENAINKLEPRKREIVRVYFQFYEEGKRSRKETIELMTKMFETTWDNIRQIISRVKKEIKESLNTKIKIK